MPYLEDSGWDVRIGNWDIYHDPVNMTWTVFIEGNRVSTTNDMFEAYDVVTNAILA